MKTELERIRDEMRGLADDPRLEEDVSIEIGILADLLDIAIGDGAKPEVPDKYVLVPKEPSMRMAISGAGAVPYYHVATSEMAKDCYRAMIAAAQEGEKWK